MTVEQLNRLPPAGLRAALGRCCGARAWIERVATTRPWRDRAALLEAAERAADALGRADWLEAFAQHPRIGDREALRRRFATAVWSAEEQRDVLGAAEEVLAALEAGNREYQARFGYSFIVCATGLDAGEMLARLRARLGNDPEHELGVAANEQRAITRLRIGKLLSEDA